MTGTGGRSIQVGDVLRGRHKDNVEVLADVVEVLAEGAGVKQRGSGKRTTVRWPTLIGRYRFEDGSSIAAPTASSTTATVEASGPVQLTVELPAAEVQILSDMVAHRNEAMMEAGAEVTTTSFLRMLIRREHGRTLGLKVSPTGQVLAPIDGGKVA